MNVLCAGEIGQREREREGEGEGGRERFR